jgi:CheY-like chemotaxis protein
MDERSLNGYGGTGLGLAICKRLANFMGGSIELESEVGLGSKFTFIVPLPKASKEEISNSVDHKSAAVFKDTEMISLNGLNILLVEDAEENRMVIEGYLRKEKCRLVIAENGAEAVEKFKNGNFDVVLMDIQMPVMDGYEATRQIRSWEAETKGRSTPIVALTAHAMADESEQIRSAGCDLHLTKPVRKKILLETIGQVTK